MKYRSVTVLPAKTLTGAQTETIAIHIRDVISRLTVYWTIGKVKIGMSSYPHRDITKIELVDGSDVLFSMDGGQAAALNIYDRSCPTYWCGISINANEVSSWYSIDFGRWLFDELLALDPSKFSNLQLKVSVNPALCEVGCASGDLTVVADVFDEQVPTPTGFLMSKEHYASVMAQTGAYEYIDIPTDFPIRKMLIQGYRSAKEPWLQVAEARLDEENTKRIPFDWNMFLYYSLRKSIDQPVQEHISSQAEGGGTALYATPTDYWASLVMAPMDGIGEKHYPAAHPGGVFVVTTVGGTSYMGVVKGWLPNHCFCFPFGYQKDISDWYDVTRLGSVRLRLRAGTYNANGTWAVTLQQNRSY